MVYAANLKLSFTIDFQAFQSENVVHQQKLLEINYCEGMNQGSMHDHIGKVPKVWCFENISDM